MRLLNSHRRRIADLLVARKYDPLEKIEKARQTDLALRLYRLQIPENVEKKADELNALQPGLVHMTQSVYVTANTLGASKNISLDRTRPGIRGYLDASSKDLPEFADEIEAVLTRHFELSGERNEALATADRALDKFTTFEKLEEAWPDVMPIVREACADMPKPVVNLPAIATADLNAMFDLPPELQEAA